MPIKFKPEIIYIQKLLKETKIKEIMTVPVIKINDNDSVSRAQELFVEHGIYYLPVVNRLNELVGVVTHKYLYKTVAPRKNMGNDMAGYSPDVVYDGDSFYEREKLDQFKLTRIMNPNPVTLRPEDSVAEAVLTMTRKNTGCIPIIKANRKICGILTHKDIVDLATLILLEEVQ